MTTTADLIARAEAALEGVTPGEWRYDGPPWNQIIWADTENRVCFMAHSSGLDDARDVATARFIAASRQLVPDLLIALKTEKARADAAEAERDELATAIDGIETSHGVTGNGNLWRWWRERARDALGKRDAELARADAAEAKLAVAVEALEHYADQLCEEFCQEFPNPGYTDKNCELDCGGCKARATLAKIGATK